MRVLPMNLLVLLTSCAATQTASQSWVGAHINEAIDHFGVPQTSQVRDRTFYTRSWSEGGAVVANAVNTGFGNSTTIATQGRGEYCNLSMEVDERGVITNSDAKGTGTKCFDIATFGKMKRPQASL